MRVLLTLLIFALSLAPATAAPPLATELAPRFSGPEIIRQKTPVPSAEKPQGEVRILQRGDAVVVQTLLYSKILKRVVGAICRKEENTWPRQRPGYNDSKRYVEALRQARVELEEQRRSLAAGEERLQTLLIEFVLAENQALIGLFEPAYGGVGGALVVREKRPIALWSAARGYVAENMLEIVQDAFALDAQAAAALLAPSASAGQR